MYWLVTLYIYIYWLASHLLLYYRVFLRLVHPISNTDRLPLPWTRFYHKLYHLITAMQPLFIHRWFWTLSWLLSPMINNYWLMSINHDYQRWPTVKHLWLVVTSIEAPVVARSTSAASPRNWSWLGVRTRCTWAGRLFWKLPTLGRYPKMVHRKRPWWSANLGMLPARNDPTMASQYPNPVKFLVLSLGQKGQHHCCCTRKLIRRSWPPSGT